MGEFLSTEQILDLHKDKDFMWIDDKIEDAVWKELNNSQIMSIFKDDLKIYYISRDLKTLRLSFRGLQFFYEEDNSAILPDVKELLKDTFAPILKFEDNVKLELNTNTTRGRIYTYGFYVWRFQKYGFVELKVNSYNKDIFEC